MEPEPEETDAFSRRKRIASAIRDGKFPAEREKWTVAYAKQSRSDLAIYELFTDQEMAKRFPPLGHIEPCHSLHYLQMACEKIAKAYRFRDTATPIEDMLTSHVAFSKFIEGFLKSPEVKARYATSAQFKQVSRIARLLAREIELLAPALGETENPANAEYPWADAMEIMIPCEYSYPNINLLRRQEGRSFLKIIVFAITNFEKTAKR